MSRPGPDAAAELERPVFLFEKCWKGQARDRRVRARANEDKTAGWAARLRGRGFGGYGQSVGCVDSCRVASAATACEKAAICNEDTPRQWSMPGDEDIRIALKLESAKNFSALRQRQMDWLRLVLETI